MLINVGAEFGSHLESNEIAIELVDILNKIDSMEAIGNVNYNDALIKVSEVLQGYTQQSDRKLVMILLTNNYPNEETPNEVAQYQTLKANYPYLSINGIQYEKGSSIMPQLSNITDHQYAAGCRTDGRAGQNDCDRFSYQDCDELYSDR